MGYSGAILVAKPDAEIDVDGSLAIHGFSASADLASGWVESESDRQEGFAVELIDALVEVLAGPVLVADVAHSDLAYLAAGAPGIQPVGLILTPKALRAEGAPVPSRRDTEASLSAFAAWSAAAPRSVDVEYLRALIRRGATFAEEIVYELLAALGIRPIPILEADQTADPGAVATVAGQDLPGYLRPLDGMKDRVRFGVELVPWSELRFVLGQGEDFLGIWDRRDPSHPLKFARNMRGTSDLFQAFAGIQGRAQLGDADSFAGLIGVAPTTGFYAGGRDLKLADSRYVPGWGIDFTGVWDREAGPDPVVRFKGRGERSRDQATSWASIAEMRRRAGAKAIGPDRWVSSHRADNFASVPMHEMAVVVVAFEEADADWRVDTAFDASDGYLMHEIVKLDDGFDLMTLGGPLPPSPDADSAKRSAEQWNAAGDWVRVPDEVPLTLLETARWSIEESPFAAGLRPHSRWRA